MSNQPVSSDANFWGMMLHFSVFASYVIPIAGVIVPIVIWQMKKEEMPIIDAHGKVVLNAIISFLIYGAVAGLLTLVFVGFLLLMVLAALGIIFPIIGGIKANNGEVWPYPLTIQFIK